MGVENEMRLGCSIVHYNFEQYSLDDAFRDMADIGYAGAETYAPPEVWQKGRTELRRLLGSHGLEPATLILAGYGVEAGIDSLADTDEDRLASTIASYRRNIELAAENGFSRMMAFPGHGHADDELPAALERAARNLGPIADYGAEHGVEILIETYRGALACDSASFLRMRDLSGSDNIYANVDPSNYAAVGEDVVAALDRLGNLTHGLHIKDIGWNGDEYFWVPAGTGEVDFPRFLRHAATLGFDGWVVVEYEAGMGGRFYSDAARASRENYELISGILDSL